MIVKAAIVEDEETDEKNLINLLKKYGEEKKIEFNITYFSDAVKLLSSYQPIYDVIFMDIKMPLMNGLDASKELRKYDSNVSLIFVTDLAQFAIKSYEVNALDFIIKPAKYEQLVPKIDKVIRLIESKGKEQQISLKVEDSIVSFYSSSIIYLETRRHHLIYHTDQGTYTVYGSLVDAIKKLPKDDFVKCNNCYLVNLKYVTSISNFEATLGKTKLQISRPKKKDFVDAFTSYLGRHS